MISKNMFVLEVDLKTVPAKEIFAFSSIRKCRYASLALRLESAGRGFRVRENQAFSFLDLFAGSVVDVVMVSGWPCNELTNHPALVCIICLDEQNKKRISRVSSHFAAWTHQDRGLPEDIALFMSQDDIPAFASCTHEQRGWLFSRTTFSFRGKESTRSTAKDMLIFDGKWGCKLWKKQSIPVKVKRWIKGATMAS
jgi:hypothetical protein